MHHEMLTQRALFCIDSNTKKGTLSQQFVTHVAPPLGHCEPGNIKVRGPGVDGCWIQYIGSIQLIAAECPVWYILTWKSVGPSHSLLLPPSSVLDIHMGMSSLVNNIIAISDVHMPWLTDSLLMCCCISISGQFQAKKYKQDSTSLGNLQNGSTDAIVLFKWCLRIHL